MHRIPQKMKRQLYDKLERYTQLSDEKLRQMKILEIEGQAIKVDLFAGIREPLKVILDPLIHQVIRHDSTCEYAQGVGESIPMRESSIDLGWCTNVIDYILQLLQVLREIQRVNATKNLI